MDVPMTNPVAETLEERSVRETAERERARREEATQVANIVVPAEIEKRRVETLAEAEAQAIEEALVASRGNRTRAAKLLGISAEGLTDAAKKVVAATVGSLCDLIGSGFTSIRPAGKTVNDSAKATASPTIIIQPKSITGRISLTNNEPNATMVVMAV